MKRYYNIQLKQHGGYIEKDFNNFMSLFLNDVGDKIKIKVIDGWGADEYDIELIKMEEEKYNKLPEFMGF